MRSNIKVGTTISSCATKLVTATGGIMIKKLLLAGVAALFLATGTAHADWQCGEVDVKVKKLTSDHLASVEFTGFFRDLLIKEGFKFQFTKNGGAKLNGKRCRELPNNPEEERSK
jgi:hypothetical protein